MAEIVTFKISADGSKVAVEASGFTGNGCMEFTKKALEKLGVVEESGKKDEYFATIQNGAKLKS
jgi:hypothetical protein